MKQSDFSVLTNRQISRNIWEMVLCGDTAAITAPGQFINLKLEGFYLRRPISVCDWDTETVTVIYKVLGHGTEEMTNFLPGKKIDVLSGLGNGYDLARSGTAPLLVGGGVGLPPLYGLAKRLRAEGKQVKVALGFNTKDEMFYLDRFQALGIEPVVATADGSFGISGLVTDAMAQAGAYSYLYTCGPERMLQAVYHACSTSGQFSFEERMGCGFGACMGCSCQTKYGNKRICKDGPVLEKEEIIW